MTSVEDAADVDSRFTPPGTGPSPLWRHLLGEELRRVRHDRGETLGETAARAGVSPQYLSEMERGLKDPSSEMIEAVAGALEVTLIDLVQSVVETHHELNRSGSTLTASGRRDAFALAA